MLDSLDRRLIGRLRVEPHSTVSDLATFLGCARGTALTRLRRLEQRKVVIGYGPDIDPGAAGLDVLAFTTLAISQGSHNRVVAHLRTISEILEIQIVAVHAVTHEVQRDALVGREVGAGAWIPGIVEHER